MHITCLIIDGQNDFCDPKGALSIPNGDKDMERLASMITKNASKIDEIRMTLDSHQPVHIAHPVCWVDENGNHPDIFTIISADEVNNGKWRAYNPADQKWQKEYVNHLANNQRYPLCIWPVHCLIGSWGWSIYPDLFDAIRAWQESQFAEVDFVTKGSNRLTEHYSAVKADVELNNDPSTSLNTRFIKALEDSDKILIAGQALSHCVANTIYDVANEFSDEQVKKFVLLEDASSSAAGFENLGQTFVDDMKKRGMEISTTDKFFN